jgi:hypothetical protein
MSERKPMPPSSFNSGLVGVFRRGIFPKYVKSISDIGIDFSILNSKNSKAISKRDMDQYEDMYLFGMGDGVEIADRSVPYFDKDYYQKVEFLEAFSSHPEIDDIISKVADEMIVYDKYGKFCDVHLDSLRIKDESVRKSIRKSFDRIYDLFGFGDGVTAWDYAYRWLQVGRLAFEIIFDDPENPTTIKGFNELDPKTLIPLIIEYKDVNGEGKEYISKRLIWKQIAPNSSGVMEERELSDNQVIMISWNKVPGNRMRLSYAERLVRSFNLMRTMENTKVGWHVMNSQYRLKMVIPVGSRTNDKAKEALAKVTNKYKEDIFVDHFSGETTINGQAKINFARNIVLPSRQGSSPEIEAIKYEGPDLNDMEGVRYFERKLWRDSKLPSSRFDRDNIGSQKMFQYSDVPYDELSSDKFIRRCRKTFEMIIKKPLYLQVIMDHVEMKIDLSFKSKLGVVYNSSAYFEEARESELMAKKLEEISNLEEKTDDNDEKIFAKQWLYVDKYGIMTKDEWDTNKSMIKDSKKDSGGEDLGI